jgi:hypothetical protein
MRKKNQYDWLIVAEGNSDISVYCEYLNSDGAALLSRIIGVGGKGYSVNMKAWDAKHIDTLRTDLGRTEFKGVILVVDSDDDDHDPFSAYCRGDDSFYIGQSPPPPTMDGSNSFWVLDSLNGTNALPLRGVNVPRGGYGCLETDLLSAYGFPAGHQPEYVSLCGIIKRATTEWEIPDNNDGKPWWEVNETAKMDKFIYAALRQGFRVSGKEPPLPPEPNVISNIRAAMT